MLISKLEVRTAQGVLLNLPLDSVFGGLYVTEIEGLDPVKATLVSSSFAQLDGAQYHSSRRDPRSLKIKLGMEPDFTKDNFQDLRNRMYGFFMPKTQVSLRFYVVTGPSVLDNYYVDILARVEEFVSPLFVQDPTIEISTLCFDPDFINPVPVVVSGSSTSDLTETALIYGGTVETGLVFTLKPARSVSAFTVYHRPPDGTLRMMDFSNALIAGDLLKISTSVGSKFVTRSRAGFDTSLLYGLSPQSDWLELQPGTNNLRIYAEGAAIPYTIEYKTKLGGL